MFKITHFTIGKNYKGYYIEFWIFKFEKIELNNKFLWKFEISNWD